MSIFRLGRWLALAFLLAACAATPPRAPEAVLRGELDTREYRHLELPNQLSVLLVSDPATDKSAASMRVLAGSGDDPADRQGLAHFLEHMLFLGTAKYPDPDEYQAFINAHGGSHNAYTATDHTHYFFDIEPGSLDSALDRFAQFFVAPLFNTDYVQREVNAVDSEYRMGLKDDTRREYDVLREIVQPDHPLASLAVGNLQTLEPARGDIRAELLAFHAKHYSANLMTLVVLGREPLDALEAMVRGRFDTITDRNAAARESAPALFAPGTLPLELVMRPVKETRELGMLFPVPSERARYAAKPLEYIANLLGHEGPGSLLALLKARGWAESLGAGAGFDQYGQDIFQVTVQLTEQGLAHEREIVAEVFREIAQLRSGGVEEWRYREQARLAELGFRFREKGDSASAVIALANALHDYPVAEVQRGPWLFADYDPALIGSYLELLRPDNLLLTLSHAGAVTERESRWFGTPYAMRKLDADALLASASADPLSLPAPNEFIPEHVQTKPAAEAATRPRALVAEPGYRLWHLQDADFALPRASLFFQLLSPRANATARDAALGALFTSLVEDELNPYAYPATLAGLQYEIAPSARGLTVRISGYDDRQAQLLERILAALGHARFAPDRFANLKAELMRGWGNAAQERPYVQLLDELQTGMMRRNWSDAQLREALAPAGPEDLAEFVAALREGAALEVLAHGNFLPAEALALGDRVRAALGGTGTPSVPPLEVRELGAGEAARAREIDHADSALLMYLQGRSTDRAERARVALAGQIVGPLFFDELRTERQLGYAVFAQPYPMARVPGLLLAVQSPAAGPEALAREFEAFLERRRADLGAMPQADFERHRAALAARLREVPGSLGEKSERLWSDLGLGSYAFDDREQVAIEVERIAREDWLRFFDERFTGKDRRAMLVYNRGSAHRAEAAGALARHPSPAPEADAKYYRFDWPRTVQDGDRALHL